MTAYNFQIILDEISSLTKNYSNVYRGTVNYEFYKKIVEHDIQLDENFDVEWLRESLLSHVGHTPVVATYLHQFIDHKSETDLGHTLKLLSIHDIGETVVGDIITTARNRTKIEEDDEYNAVKLLLNPEQLQWYNEMIDLKSNEAKFAKSVDKISPDILAYACHPKIEKARMKHFNFNLDDVYTKKKQFMSWDGFLDGFFAFMIGSTKQNHNHFN